MPDQTPHNFALHVDAVGVGIYCPDNQVIKAIAVDVPGAADRVA